MEEEETPSRRVVLVAVVGLSAAGKSTVAHALARQLHSPLHPISLDDYFDPEACETLGTFDDYATVDFGKFVRHVQRVKEVLAKHPEESGSQGWRSILLDELPSFKRYVIPQGEVTGVTAPASDSATQEPGPVCEGEDDDDSLAAHEEEEALLRAQSAATAINGTSSCRLARTGAADLREETVYVVCEGFCLLCSEAVVSARLFEACVWVRCPMEDACRRRFHRTPRRRKPANAGHGPGSGASVYQARIQLLWRTRTEERREQLCTRLSKQDTMSPTKATSGDESMGTSPVGISGGSGLTPRELASMRALLAPGSDSLFYPPGTQQAPLLSPRQGDDGETAIETSSEAHESLWDTATGAPIGPAFAALWERFAKAHPTPCTSAKASEANGKEEEDASSLFLSAVTSMDSMNGLLLHEPPHYGREGSGEHHGGSVFISSSQREEVDADHKAARYLEFRYWFYFEVVYYYCLFLPLQRCHARLAMRAVKKGHITRVENGPDVTRADLATRTAAIAKELMEVLEPI